MTLKTKVQIILCGVIGVVCGEEQVGAEAVAGAKAGVSASSVVSRASTVRVVVPTLGQSRGS